MSSGKVPAAPTYAPPPAYTPPAPYVSPPDPSTSVPAVLSPTDIMAQGQGVEAMLPQWLQLNNNPMEPAGMAQYGQNFYNQNIAPQIAQAQASMYANGQSYGSYGGALLGQLQAQGQSQAYNAGLNYAQQLYQDQLQGRQSYFAGGPSIAQQQNNQNVSRGLSVAQLQSSNANNQNTWDLNQSNAQNQYGFNSAQLQDNFNLDNYKNQLQAYQLQQANKANMFGSIVGGAGMLLSGGSGLLSSFGGGGNTFSGGGGFSGASNFGSSPGTFSLGNVTGSNPAPMQTINGALGSPLAYGTGGGFGSYTGSGGGFESIA